ncbi:unnamed protein product [Pieris brassicae]|uniref:Uncharacterized protein n=1 Tax=Pieris brassicae TaxID=7116 RepID=A0A9P0XJG5_PIEBR|nr:unnamed protein product [Pieris brassicae]
MEMSIKENPMPRSDSTSSNQLFIAENLDLPDDTFRMSLDYLSEIGENVTIGGRNTSIDVSVKHDSNTAKTPSMPITPTSSTHKSPVLQCPLLPHEKQLCETPKLLDEPKDCKQINLLKQSLTKKENDGFVRPSPVAEVMSPAKMLQFEIDVRSSATPTMKRAAIDFNFFNDNKFEEYFKDENNSNEKETGVAYKETTVIVKASTVRHEIGYGLWNISILANLRS